MRTQIPSVAALVCLALPMCRTAVPDGATRAHPSAQPEPRIPPLRASGELPAELAATWLWQRAESTDPSDLSTLARELGAARLLGRITDGGHSGWVALSALPFASDAWAERATLCSLVERVDAADRVSVLRSLHAILNTPHVLGEELEDSSDERCLAALSTALRGDQAPDVFDLYASIRAQLSVPGSR